MSRFLRAVVLLVLVAAIAGCNHDAGSSADAQGNADAAVIDAAMLVDALVTKDLWSGNGLDSMPDLSMLALRGIACGAVTCQSDEFCIESSPGLPFPDMGPPIPRCQVVAPCAAGPASCRCFQTTADNDCYGSSFCEIQESGLVFCGFP